MDAKSLYLTANADMVYFLGVHKSDPKPVAELIKKITKVYSYEAGGFGTSVAELLSGKGKLGRITAPGRTRVLTCAAWACGSSEGNVGARSGRSRPRTTFHSLLP